MAKFKTKGNGAKLLSVSGELRVLSETEGWLQKVELWLVNGETNRNNWRYANLEAHKSLFAETPILCAYVGDKIGDAHNFKEIREKDGSVRASFMEATAERIVGYFKSDSDIRTVERDGKTWIVGIGYIWRWYAAELVDKLREQGLEGMSVSIETLIDEGHMEGETEVFTKYQILGTTILGDGVAPAVEDANIRVLAALGADGVKKMTLKVASAQAAKNYPQKNNTKGVKKMVKLSEVKKKLAEFQVLSVFGDKVLFADEGNTLYTCSAVAENGETVVGEKIPVDMISIVANGEEMKVDFATVIGHMNAEIEKSKRDFDAEHTARMAAESALEKMKTAENARRKATVLAAIDARFAQINAMRSDKLDAKIIEPLKLDEKIGCYAEMEDKNGNFCGDIEAMHDVDSVCMEQMISSEVHSNAKKTYAWEIGAPTAEHKDAVESAITNICKE